MVGSRRFTLSAGKTIVLLTFGLSVNLTTRAAVPINSFYGVWMSTVIYPKGSVVTSGGSSYIALLGSTASPNRNHSPLTSSKWWTPFAAQGAQGIPGPPGTSGPLLVDKNGTTIGRYIFQTVLMNINGMQVLVSLDSNFPLLPPQTGFYSHDASNLEFFHLASDCSDARYMLSGSPYTAYNTYTVNNQRSPLYLYYPTAPGKILLAQAQETFVAGQSPTSAGTCTASQSSNVLSLPGVI